MIDGRPGRRRRAHILYYPGRRRDSTCAPAISHVRDGGAGHLVSTGLFIRGIAEPGELLFNTPPKEAPNRLLDYEACAHVNLSDVASGDLLVLATRPPVDEFWQNPRKKVEPGNTRLERVIFRIVNRYLEICSRSHLRLAKPLRDQLPPELMGRAETSFFQKDLGLYKQFNPGSGWRYVDADFQRTAAFLLYLESLWEGGPGLVAAFSMSGLSSLVFAWRLRHDLAHLLDEPGFKYWELEPGDVPERPTELSWAASWSATPVLEVPPL